MGPMNSRRLPSPTVLAGLVVTLASLGLFISTLAPTLTWGFNKTGVDGGELLAAANRFGVPHPPGYPTYTLLLKLFATVVPIGDFAYRGNLLSALLAAVSVALLYLVILRFCRFLRPTCPEPCRIASAALGSLAFATSPLFWSQAVMTEVYTLNTFFVGSLLLIATKLALRLPREGGLTRKQSTIWIALFGLLLGLGLGNHLTLISIALPLIIWLSVTIGWARLLSLWSVGALILGLGIYIYLPVSAAQEPPVNWGNADTFAGMAWMLTGRVYQEYVFAVPAEEIPRRLAAWLQLIYAQFNPLGLFLGLFGALPRFMKERGFLIASSASILILSAYGIMYNTFDYEVLMIPAFMLFSIWLGVGFLAIVASAPTWAETLIDRLQALPLKALTPHTLMILSAAAFAALPLTSVILNYEAQNLSDDDQAYRYAKEVIDAVPDGSVVMSTEEDTVFSLWYIRYVGEPERDVAPIAVPLLQFDWYWRNIHSRYPDRFPERGPTDIGEGIRRIVGDNSGRSRVFFTYRDRFLEESFELTTVGKLLEARLKRAS